MRTIKQAILLVNVMAILGCTATTPQNKAHIAIEVRTASFEHFDQSSALPYPDSERTIYVSQQSLLTQSDFISASLSKDNKGNSAVTLDLSQQAGQRLFDYTSKNIGMPLAIFIDEKLIFAPIVVSAIKNKIMITGGRDGLPENQAKEIVNSINKKT